MKSFQVAQLVYDVTVRFCERYVDRFSRTRDQMEQAARSGVQNIAEGSQASGTSRKTELKLTNVARASLEELRRDYEDFLRQRGLRDWGPDDPRRAELVALRPADVDVVARWVHGICADGEAEETAGAEGALPSHAEAAANAALTLIGVAGSLLDRQLAAQARAFKEEGGFSERLGRVRRGERRGG